MEKLRAAACLEFWNTKSGGHDMQRQWKYKIPVLSSILYSTVPPYAGTDRKLKIRNRAGMNF